MRRGKHRDGATCSRFMNRRNRFHIPILTKGDVYLGWWMGISRRASCSEARDGTGREVSLRRPKWPFGMAIRAV